MSRIKDTYNLQGTKITEFVCEFCGTIFTVCPAVNKDKDDDWKGCMDLGCKSYDPDRDADKFFEEEMIIRKRNNQP